MFNSCFVFLLFFFFNSLAMSRYLSFFSLSFSFILWSAGTAKSTSMQVLFFLLIITRFGRLAKIRWSVCISRLLLLFTPWDFFKSVLADDFSLEFKWQQVSSISRTLLSILVVKIIIISTSFDSFPLWYKVCSKGFQTEAVFNKTEMNNKWQFNFLQNTPFSFSKIISANFPLVGIFFFFLCIPIYQPLRSGRIWHKVNFFPKSISAMWNAIFPLYWGRDFPHHMSVGHGWIWTPNFTSFPSFFKRKRREYINANIEIWWEESD